MTLEKIKPGVSVRLGGQERRLYFDHWAFASISEDDDGRDRIGLLSRGRADLDVVVFLVWAALLHDYPELEGATKLERRQRRRLVAEWFEADDVDIVDVSTALGKALANASPILKSKKKLGTTSSEPEKSTG